MALGWQGAVGDNVLAREFRGGEVRAGKAVAAEHGHRGRPMVRVEFEYEWDGKCAWWFPASAVMRDTKQNRSRNGVPA